MPEAKRKSAKELEKQIEEAEGISLRSNSAKAVEERRKKEEEEERKHPQKKWVFPLLYVVMAILVFFLGLLVIATMNYFIHGEFGI